MSEEFYELDDVNTHLSMVQFNKFIEHLSKNFKEDSFFWSDELTNGILDNMEDLNVHIFFLKVLHNNSKYLQ